MIKRYPFIIILLIIGLFISPLVHLPFYPTNVVLADKVFEYWNTGDDYYEEVYGANWFSQTFTPTTSHTINSVKLKLWRQGIAPGVLTVGIRDTIGGTPTGEDLCNGTYDIATITIGPSGAWHEINFSSGHALVATTQYAIVVRATGGDGSRWVAWQGQDFGGDAYSGGQADSSVNSGGAWFGGVENTEDFMFEEWGVSLPTVTTQAASSIEETTATGNGNIGATGGENCDKKGIVYDLGTQALPGNVAPAASGYANSEESVGSFSTGAFTIGLTGLAPGTKYYARAYTHNSAGYSYGAEVNFTTKPNAPTNLAETATTVSSISTNWTKGTGAEKTMVRYQAGSYPATVASGTQAYFDTSNTTTVATLSAGTTYYFRAWSYKTDAPNSGYSDSYAQDTATTSPGTPSVSTVAATDVSTVSAQLNAFVDSDGGQACDVRFQYNETFLPCNTTNATIWTVNSTWINDTYITGQYPYNTTGLLTNATTYFFRVQIRNDNTTQSGSVLCFTTGSIFEPPTSFMAYPNSHDTELSWIKGNNTAGTLIKAKIGAYPDNVTDGTEVYNSTGSTSIYEPLTPGVSYYYRAWGVAGSNYTANYTDVMATTSAGAGAGSSPGDPDTPSTWWSTPDYTNMEDMFFYSIINDLADDYSTPRNTVWTLLTIVLIMTIGIIIYATAHQPAVAIISVGGLMWFASVMGLMPFWIAFVYSVPAISIMVVARRT